ncbi:hypothetical protein FQA39_LY12975 [Lamprigera yunnana]|nr:hypothetical protein FQA39_LY12975 [Lamprigera yunnana]
MSIGEELDFVLNVSLTETQAIISNLVLKEIVSRVSFLNEVGLNYLTLSRAAATLSGGEAQRIRLAKQIGSQLTGICRYNHRKYLSGREKIHVPTKRRGGNGKYIEVLNATENNLRSLSVKIPLGTFTSITGVSGSGKSTLMEEIIYKGIVSALNKDAPKVKNVKDIRGLENIDKAIYISQDPIDLFTNVNESKIRGYKKGRFSFNVPGGRCEHCQGDGVITISMQFMPSVEVVCEICEGKRYNEETLQVLYKGKNISDVLNMTVEEGQKFFENVPQISSKLETILEVGLGYIRLGQSATTLSGGESQRIKLSTYLLKKSTGKTLFLLDEPTTGLHTDDVKRLIEVLNRLVDLGNTVITIEHNLDFIKVSDFILDLGPDGGTKGGTLVSSGTPEQVAKSEKSYTAKYLRGYL